MRPTVQTRPRSKEGRISEIVRREFPRNRKKIDNDSVYWKTEDRSHRFRIHTVCSFLALRSHQAKLRILAGNSDSSVKARLTWTSLSKRPIDDQRLFEASSDGAASIFESGRGPEFRTSEFGLHERGMLLLSRHESSKHALQSVKRTGADLPVVVSEGYPGDGIEEECRFPSLR